MRIGVVSIELFSDCFRLGNFNLLSCREDDLSDLDVTVTSRPHQSEPMQMPGNLL